MLPTNLQKLSCECDFDLICQLAELLSRIAHYVIREIWGMCRRLAELLFHNVCYAGGTGIYFTTKNGRFTTF